MSAAVLSRGIEITGPGHVWKLPTELRDEVRVHACQRTPTGTRIVDASWDAWKNGWTCSRIGTLLGPQPYAVAKIPRPPDPEIFEPPAPGRKG